MFHPQGPSFFELARQCLSSTERGYDLLAPKFDYTPFRTPDSVLEVVRDYLSESSRGTSGYPTALDICCGTGAAMRMFAPLVKERLVGLDFSQGMLLEARRRGAGDGPRHVELVRADALRMPWGAEFDLAFSFGALGHIRVRDERDFVGEVRRVLKPGGRFVFVTSEAPKIWSRSFWLSHGFNVAMRLRNLAWRPTFIMYYLTFLLPRAKELLEADGFRVQTPPCKFPAPFQPLKLVVAEKGSS
jgi:ubiquinone/menaquinone biosynthesis C-methylase UbiE